MRKGALVVGLVGLVLGLGVAGALSLWAGPPQPLPRVPAREGAARPGRNDVGPARSGTRSFAQSAVWQKNLGGTADEGFHQLVLLPDGSSVHAGFSSSRDGDIVGSHGRKDALVAHLGADGKPLWTKVYGGLENDLAYAIDRTADGGYVVAGGTQNDDTAVGYHGGFDVWVLRLDAAGEVLWRRCYGGSGEDTAYSIRQTADGGFILGGSSGSINGDLTENRGREDAWVVKLSPTGDLEWERCLGGPLDDAVFCVEPLADGGYVAAGRIASHTEDELTSSHGLGNVLVARLTATGSVVWQQNYGGVDEERAFAVRPTGDGGFIVAGEAGSRTGIVTGWKGSLDAWVLKLDQVGSITWQNCFGGLDDDIAYSIRERTGGGYIFAGETGSFDGDVAGTHNRSDAWLVALDASGFLLWQKTLGGGYGDRAYDVRETPGGTFLLAGTCTPVGAWDLTPGHAGYDAWALEVRP